MRLDLHSEQPRQPLYPQLAELVKDATYVDLAVAFVTKFGTDAILEIVNRLKGRAEVRLLVSVLFPTNLISIARLAELIDVHIHLASMGEAEKIHGQFHSKVMLIEREDSSRTVVIGSHNWTEYGLNGENLEASLIVDCMETDSIVAQTREHIEACRLVSERFNPTRMDFYETIQRQFQPKLPAVKAKKFPGFEPSDVFAILAEDWTDSGRISGELYVHLPIEFDGEIETQMPVWIFLFEKDTLFGHSYPLPEPTLCIGNVITKDLGDEHSISPDSKGYFIRDIAKPTLEVATSIPRRAYNQLLMIANFDKRGQSERVPLFHNGTGPNFVPALEAAPEHDVYADAYDDADEELGMDSPQNRATPARMVPTFMIAESILKVPFQFVLPPTARLLVESFGQQELQSSNKMPVRVKFEEPLAMSNFACVAKFKSNPNLTDIVYSSSD